MANLRFNVDELRPLIAHSEAATKHRMAYGQHKQEPGLMLVKDSGIYLMSTGLPGLLRADSTPENTHNVVVYALGFKPDDEDSYDKCRDAVGGDDFSEVLPLAWFTKAREVGATSVTIRFGKRQIGIAYALPKQKAAA